MSIDIAAAPSPQPKAASAGLGQNGRLKSGAQGGSSIDDSGSFSTLLAVSTENTDHADSAPGQDSVRDAAKDESPQSAPPANLPPLDLAALLALAGQAEAARATTGAADMPAMADGPPARAMARRAPGAAGISDLPTSQPVEAITAQRAGAPVRGALQAGKSGGVDMLSVTPGSADGHPTGTAAARAAEKLEIQGLRLEAFSREPALAGLVAASGLGDGLVRQPGASTDKPFGRFTVSSFEGPGGSTQAATGAPGEILTPSDVVTVQTTDTMLADTVSYWVSQGVQKAELKLDGFGDEPIEVSISLANGEAQIGFRTDRADVREVIEGAMSHLKELLASEGLVLAGVSVGTSGQDRSGAQAQRERAAARNKGISLVEPEAAVATPRSRPVPGRTVDLFV
jgi:flagellar hook-length control protein FliK